MSLNQLTSLSGTGKQDAHIMSPFELENLSLKEKIGALKDKLRRHKDSYTFAFNDMHLHIS